MQIAVVGTGLIGASVALAARGADAATTVVGWDPDAEALAPAARGGAVEPAGSLAEAAGGADLIVVAAPRAQLPRAVTDAIEAGGGATVTDVGSAKAAVCAAAGAA